MKVFFVKYTYDGASSRVRTYNFLRLFPELFSDILLQPLIAPGHPRFSILHIRSYLLRFICLLRLYLFSSRIESVYIEKELFPWCPLPEHLLLSPFNYHIDYDDHPYERYARIPFLYQLMKFKHHQLWLNSKSLRTGSIYTLKLLKKCSPPARLIYLPSCVNLDLVQTIKPVKADIDVPLIVWVGSRSTQEYLSSITNVLVELKKQIPLRFIVLGTGQRLNFYPSFFEIVKWSEESEKFVMTRADIGVMPLPSTKWARGKCAYKIIQYFAYGIPVVADSVGHNRFIVQNSVTGFLCNSEQDWLNSLLSLCQNSSIRKQMSENILRIRPSYDYSSNLNSFNQFD